jgi:Amt family ammonium transporter
MAMNGFLSGCASITGSAGTVEPWAACLTGVIAGWVYIAESALLVRWKIDDAVDTILSTSSMVLGEP